MSCLILADLANSWHHILAWILTIFMHNFVTGLCKTRNCQGILHNLAKFLVRSHHNLALYIIHLNGTVIFTLECWTHHVSSSNKDFFAKEGSLNLEACVKLFFFGGGGGGGGGAHICRYVV